MACNGMALTFAFIASTFPPATVLATETGIHGGVDAFAGAMHGRSSTRDGGAAFAGGGGVEDVKFRSVAGIGGHAGMRIMKLPVGDCSYLHAGRPDV